MGLFMCSLRDRDCSATAAAAAAIIDSCMLEVTEVTQVGVPGAGVLGGELVTELPARGESGQLGKFVIGSSSMVFIFKLSPPAIEKGRAIKKANY